MTTTKPKKKFDAVQSMREARDRLNEEFANKSFEERRRLIEERLRERKDAKQ